MQLFLQLLVEKNLFFLHWTGYTGTPDGTLENQHLRHFSIAQCFLLKGILSVEIALERAIFRRDFTWTERSNLPSPLSGVRHHPRWCHLTRSHPPCLILQIIYASSSRCPETRELPLYFLLLFFQGGSSNRSTDSKTTRAPSNLKSNPKPRVSPHGPEYLLLGQSE